jgi:hypothetical protein
VREPRLERQRGNRTTVIGEVARLVDRAERSKTLARFFECRDGRRIKKGEAGWVRFAPQQAGEQKAGQIGFEDFGRIVRGQ